MILNDTERKHITLARRITGNIEVTARKLSQLCAANFSFQLTSKLPVAVCTQLMASNTEAS